MKYFVFDIDGTLIDSSKVEPVGDAYCACRVRLSFHL